MAASQPPTENLSAFNSTVFKDANTESLSLSKAQSLFLGRTGNPTSIATTTTFTSDIFVKGTIRAGMGVNTSLTTPATSQQTAFGVGALVANNTTAGSTAFGYNALNLYTGQSTFTTPTAFGSNALSKIEIGGYACAFGTNALKDATGSSNNAFGANAGASLTTGLGNIFVGGDYPVGGGTPNGNKITTGDNNVFVGQEPICAGIDTNNSIILGTRCTITGNNAVAIGYQSSAGLNQISLGTSTETVLCKGTTANGSLVADADIFVKGTIRAGMGVNTTYTTPATSFNTCLGVSTLADAVNNSGRHNTAIGYEALKANRVADNSVAIGSGCLAKQLQGGSQVAIGKEALNTFTNGGGNNIAIGDKAGFTTNSTNNVFVGYLSGQSSTGADNVYIGSNFGNINSNTGASNTFVGSKVACSGAVVASSTALGFQSSIGTFSNSTVIGAGATATADNQIVLGRSTESVVIPSTGTSLTTSGSISAVGAVTTTSTAGMSARVYNLDEYNATANTPYVGALLQQGAIGSLRIFNNKAGGTTPVDTQLYISTMKADKTQVDSLIITPTVATFSGGIISTGTTAGVALYNSTTGTNNYFQTTYVNNGTCEMLMRNDNQTTPTATQFNFYTYTTGKAQTTSMIIGNSAIQMNLPITLQSTYSAVAAAGQLGNIVATSSTSFSVSNGTAVSFASFSNLAAGVWAFSYTIDLTTAGGTATATIQSLYMTLTNNGAYSTKVAQGGSTRTHNTIVYAIGDNPCFSSALTYSTTATTSFYPTFLISFTGAGATISANGYATATRIG